MLVYLALSIAAGILAGTFTGLTPAIHINLVMALIPVLGGEPFLLLFFIVALAITHSFLDFIPSIYFGAPDEDTGLASLPGHDFLLKGLGHYAVKLSAVGSFLAVIVFLFIFPAVVFLLPAAYPFISRFLGLFLIDIAVLMIYLEKRRARASFFVLIASGFLGLASLSLPVRNNLLPLLGGLFGSSTLIYSIRSRPLIPAQLKDVPKEKVSLFRPAILTGAVSPVCALFPGLGSSQAAIISSSLGRLDRKEFLVLLGSINTLVMASSLVLVFVVGKIRTGAAAALFSLKASLPDYSIYLIVGEIFLVSIFAYFLTIFISSKLSSRIHKFDYSRISFLVLCFVSLVVLLFSGFLGFFIFFVSTFLGLLCIRLKVRRGFLMGSLLLPAIFYYF